MNRLVIVGNGFDLAHGLPTGYCDFINNYWCNVFSVFSYLQYKFDYEDGFIKFNFDIDNLPMPILEDFRKIETYLDYTEFVERCSELSIDTEGFNYIDFHNSFFRVINYCHSIQNWVDIENEYYKLLKKCLKDEDNANVKKLNTEFEEVKRLLESYLSEGVSNKFNFKYNENLVELASIFKIKPHYLSKIKNHDYLNEFSKNDQQIVVNFDDKVCDAVERDRLYEEIMSGNIQQTNLFLNFNYTKTIDAYIGAMDGRAGLNHYGQAYQIQIHGRLNDVSNQINFGFGDEMDDDYKNIEKKDDNEYLKNIKSFQYLQTSNYKRLLDFIDSDKFQVFIMGHSCGLSDRILLNKIFEHKHCASIKVFYYEKNGWDNYTEIIQNISRHFNKKEMMRERIVDKSHCQPLPQIQLPLNKNGSQS